MRCRYHMFLLETPKAVSSSFFLAMRYLREQQTIAGINTFCSEAHGEKSAAPAFFFCCCCCCKISRLNLVSTSLLHLFFFQVMSIFSLFSRYFLTFFVPFSWQSYLHTKLPEWPKQAIINGRTEKPVRSLFRRAKVPSWPEKSLSDKNLKRCSSASCRDLVKTCMPHFGNRPATSPTALQRNKPRENEKNKNKNHLISATASLPNYAPTQIKKQFFCNKYPLAIYYNSLRFRLVAESRLLPRNQYSPTIKTTFDFCLIAHQRKYPFAVHYIVDNGDSLLYLAWYFVPGIQYGLYLQLKMLFAWFCVRVVLFWFAWFAHRVQGEMPKTTPAAL